MSAGRPVKYPIDQLKLGQQLILPWEYNDGSPHPVNGRSIQATVSKIRRMHDRDFECAGTPAGYLVKRTR